MQGYAKHIARWILSPSWLFSTSKKKIGSYPETVPRNRPELSTWNWIFCMNNKTVNSAFLWCEDQNYADLRGSISRLDLHTYKSHSIILFLLIIRYLNFSNNFICNKQYQNLASGLFHRHLISSCLPNDRLTRTRWLFSQFGRWGWLFHVILSKIVVCHHFMFYFK